MDLYQLLEIDRNATADEIRKAYLKLSKKHHPDRGGDPEQFKKIQKAYDVLSDIQARDFYNMTGSIPGDDGEMPGPGPGPGGPDGAFHFDMGNIFNMFTGGGNGGHRHNQPPQKMAKGPTKTQDIGLTLQQFYNGHRLDMKFERMKFCDGCSGSGAEKKDRCDGCGGSGTQVQRIMMGPVIMTSNGPCQKCAGKGTIIHDKCKVCDGKGLVGDNRHLGIMIEPGMGAGDVLVFENGCSDDHMFEKPGDVKIVLQEAEESHNWHRNGDTLEYSITLSLGEGLLGCTKKIVGHPRIPDGLYVNIPAATVTGDVIVLKGEGMPVRGSGGKKGDAHLHVTIEPTIHERLTIKEHGDRVLRDLLGVVNEWNVADAIEGVRR